MKDWSDVRDTLTKALAALKVSQAILEDPQQEQDDEDAYVALLCTKAARSTSIHDVSLADQGIKLTMDRIQRDIGHSRRRQSGRAKETARKNAEHSAAERRQRQRRQVERKAKEAERESAATSRKIKNLQGSSQGKGRRGAARRSRARRRRTPGGQAP